MRVGRKTKVFICLNVVSTLFNVVQQCLHNVVPTLCQLCSTLSNILNISFQNILFFCLGKKVLGLFPKLHGSKIQTAKQCFKQAKRRVYHHCWSIIIDAIKATQKDGGFWVTLSLFPCLHSNHISRCRYEALMDECALCFQSFVS